MTNVTNAKRYVVVQSVPSGTWRHYLCGWVGSGGSIIRDGIHPVPVFLPKRDVAGLEPLVLDEETARQLVAMLDLRYRRVVLHAIEEVSHD